MVRPYYCSNCQIFWECIPNVIKFVSLCEETNYSILDENSLYRAEQMGKLASQCLAYGGLIVE